MIWPEALFVDTSPRSVGVMSDIEVMSEVTEVPLQPESIRAGGILDDLVEVKSLLLIDGFCICSEFDLCSVGNIDLSIRRMSIGLLSEVSRMKVPSGVVVCIDETLDLLGVKVRLWVVGTVSGGLGVRFGWGGVGGSANEA
jgi:hypothetical protein